MDARAIPPPTVAATRWVERRTVTADQVPPLKVLHARKRAEGLRISVGVPAFDDAATIGRICGVIRKELMVKLPFVDELVVLDSDSIDETALRARAAGAHVVDVHELMPEVPPSPGKGDSLWRSLSELSGDLIVWVDGDTSNFEPHIVTRLVAPLLMDPSIGFVKSCHEQTSEIDIEMDGVLYRAGGANMTELLARPLINLFFPELGGFFQPLAGAYAGRMNVLRRIPFFSGCSVDVATLIDVLDVVGLDGMAQADVGPKIVGDRPLDELGPRAHAIARTILKRADERKRIKLSPNVPTHPLLVPQGTNVAPMRIDEIERPPIDVVPPYLAALSTGGSDGPARRRALRNNGGRSASRARAAPRRALNGRGLQEVDPAGKSSLRQADRRVGRSQLRMRGHPIGAEPSWEVRGYLNEQHPLEN